MAYRSLLPQTSWNVASSRRRTGLVVIQARQCLKVVANSSSGDQDNRARSQHGKQFENKNRRRGRPAWMRSPYDSPLRDGNRDRLIGLLTERAAKTLMIYLQETNANVYSWLINFYKANPIPRNGSWDEVSGEAFLRKLLAMPIEEAKYNTGRDSLFDNVRSCGVDPRSIAQRIMDIRKQLADEFIQELQAVAEENSLLLRETLASSLTSAVNPEQLPSAHAQLKPLAPAPGKDDSSINDKDSSKQQPQQPPRPSSRPRNNIQRPKVSTPPQSWRRYRPPGTPDFSTVGNSSSDSSSSGVDDAEKAAALAALNAALRASDALPAGAAGSHPELQSGSGDNNNNNSGSEAAGGAAGEGKMNMQDIIAQLQRSLDAEAAQLTAWNDAGNSHNSAPTSSAAEATSSATVESDADVVAAEDEQVTLQEALTTAAATAAVDAMEPAAAEVDASSVLDEADQVTLQEALTTAAATAAVEAMESAAADAAADDFASIDATVEDDVFLATAESEQPDSLQDAPAPFNNNSVLPKGWGPRLGVGFSTIPVRNNIVTVKKLISKATPTVAAAESTSAEQQ